MKKGDFLLIDKPANWTSFDVVNVVRKKARTEQGIKNIRVGHAGTLDPFATGLLIVGVGREATKRLDEFKNLSKTYEATVRLGATSDTDDPTGKIDELNIEEGPATKKVKIILKKFIGQQEQIPPMYSAKKIGGKILYKLARQGKTIVRKPSLITINKIKLISYRWPEIKIEVICSAGTYIRTLAHDIGEALGVGGYCSELRRTKIGKYNLKNATEIEGLTNRQKYAKVNA